MSDNKNINSESEKRTQKSGKNKIKNLVTRMSLVQKISTCAGAAIVVAGIVCACVFIPGSKDVKPIASAKKDSSSKASSSEVYSIPPIETPSKIDDTHVDSENAVSTSGGEVTAQDDTSTTAGTNQANTGKSGNSANAQGNKANAQNGNSNKNNNSNKGGSANKNTQTNNGGSKNNTQTQPSTPATQPSVSSRVNPSPSPSTSPSPGSSVSSKPSSSQGRTLGDAVASAMDESMKKHDIRCPNCGRLMGNGHNGTCDTTIDDNDNIICRHYD